MPTSGPDPPYTPGRHQTTLQSITWQAAPAYPIRHLRGMETMMLPAAMNIQSPSVLRETPLRTMKMRFLNPIQPLCIGQFQSVYYRNMSFDIPL